MTYYFIQAELEDRDLDGEVDIDVWNDGAGPGETDPEETDSDNGGSPDGQEVIVYGVLHSSDPAGFDNSDGNDEFIHGLPLYCNLQEIYYGTDPTNHADHPNVNEVPAWIMDPNPIQGNDDDAFEDFDGDGLLNFMEDVDLDRNYNPVLNIDLCAWDDPDTDDDGLNDYEEVGAGTDPENVDSDGDDVWDWNGPGNPNDYYEIDWNLDTDGDGLKNAMDPDSDGDGMLDEWEYVKMQEFADMTGAEYHESPVYPVRDDREKDEDIGSGWVDLDGKYHILGDGLTNWEEYAGQDDNPETMEDNTDPLDQDMDNDGLPDSEWRTSNTEPKDDDTDKDGLKDGDETTSWIVTGIQSAKGTPHWPTTSHPNKKDSDGDGLWDGDERWGDRGPNDEDNWENGDGILGLDEVNNNNYYVTDPNKPDSDDDGLLDGNDISLSDTDLLFSELDRIHIHNEERIDGDYDFWGELIGHFTYHPTNPRRGDTDDDGLMDGFNMDYDGDGIIDHLGELTNHGYGNTDPNNNNCDSHLGDNLLDGQEVQQGSNPNANPNTDGDGLSDKEEWDGWDVKLKIGGGITYPVQSDPTSVDGDGDGLSDAQERVGSDGILPGNPGDHHDATDPNNPDSDGDGLIDYQEVYGISLANTANDWDSDQGVDPGTLVMNSDEFYNYFYNDETWIINGYEWPTEGNLMSHLGTRNIGNNEKLHDTYWMMGDKDGNGVEEFYKYF